MSIIEHYENRIYRIKSEIKKMEEIELMGINTEELVNYHFEANKLPTIVVDTKRKIMVKKASVDHPDPKTVIIYYPILPTENIEKVISMQASRYYLNFNMGFDRQTHSIIVACKNVTTSTINNTKAMVETEIDRKNKDIKIWDDRLKTEIKNFILERKKKIKETEEHLDRLIQESGIPLEKRPTKFTPFIDFRIKEKVKPLIKSEVKREGLRLDKSKVNDIIEIVIDNTCRGFETTPKTYSQFDEPELRDIIMNHLNVIFEGGATGETFSKLGKTDIYLRISKGNILIIECKFWKGKKKYLEAIDQLFKYLTWRHNYGIIITFCKKKGFSEIIQNAIEITKKHSIFFGSINKRNESQFESFHKFPDDDKKEVEIIHLLYNLYYS